MSLSDRTILAVVPARGGSKGIPRKNLQMVGHLSLIGWTARTVQALPWLDAAVLSTDDDEIAAEGRRCGLDVPFMRPDEFATDVASSVGMWQHAWLESEKHFGHRFDCSILLQPTTPIREASDIERTVRAVVDDGHRAAVTVSPVPGHFTPEKLLVLDAAGCVAPQSDLTPVASRRQDAGAYYWRNGACYAVCRDTLIDDGRVIEDDCVAVVVDEQLVNIDDPFELDLAGFLVSKRSGTHE